MFDIVELQQKLASAYGPSGREAAVARVVEELARPFADDISTDALGNLIVRKRGTGSKLMFCAHMDSLGCVITHVDENGFLRFSRIGGLPLWRILGSAVIFESGVRGIISADGKLDLKAPKLDNFYIDIGASDESSARDMVKVGDIAVFDQKTFAQGQRLVSPYLDDRIGCAVLLCALEKIESPVNDLYFVFSVQEELGGRGAKTAAFGIDPDFGFAVDVTGTGDTPECKPKMECALGGGAAVKIMDSSVICHPKVVEYLKKQAEEKKITIQDEILQNGGTDAGPIHTNRLGVYTGAVSIPTRYIHNPIEMCDLRDVSACVELVTAACGIHL